MTVQEILDEIRSLRNYFKNGTRRCDRVEKRILKCVAVPKARLPKKGGKPS